MKTINDMSLEWLKSIKIKVKESTYVKYHSIINKHINENIGDIFIESSISKIIVNYTDKLMYGNNKKLSNKTIKDILSVLNSILKYYKNNYDNSFSYTITYPREEKLPITILTEEEIKKLETYLLYDTDIKKIGILLTLYTGIRIGDAYVKHKLKFFANIFLPRKKRSIHRLDLVCASSLLWFTSA